MVDDHSLMCSHSPWNNQSSLIICLYPKELLLSEVIGCVGSIGCCRKPSRPKVKTSFP